MATTAVDAEVEPPAAETTLKEIDFDSNRFSMGAAEEISSPLSDGEVFAAEVTVAEPKANEDVDSFYGSDKEIDSEVVFSHTDSSSSSSSSSESDIEPDRTQQVKIDFFKRVKPFLNFNFWHWFSIAEKRRIARHCCARVSARERDCRIQCGSEAHVTED